MEFNLSGIGIDKGTVKWHLLAWFIYFLYACSMIIPYPELIITDIILANIVSVICFYSCIPFISTTGERKYWRGVVLLLTSITLFFVCRALLYYVYETALKRKSVPAVLSRQFWIEGFYIYIHLFLNALGYYFLKRSADRQRKISQVTEEKAKVEFANNELEKKILLEEKMRNLAEANFLRAQINPHFLQNTLNFLYAQSITGKTAALSEGILLLSEMMRYSLQNQGDSNARVPLKDEVQHIRNYIEINQLRFSRNLQVKCTITGEAGELTIIPLVLLTLLENAFKYGELNDAAAPMVIKLEMNESNGTLYFEVKNKIRRGPAEHSSGIGIGNTRRRLDTAYPGGYILESHIANNIYTATLRIQLQQKMAA